MAEEAGRFKMSEYRNGNKVRKAQRRSELFLLTLGCVLIYSRLNCGAVRAATMKATLTRWHSLTKI